MTLKCKWWFHVPCLVHALRGVWCSLQERWYMLCQGWDIGTLGTQGRPLRGLCYPPHSPLHRTAANDFQFTCHMLVHTIGKYLCKGQAPGSPLWLHVSQFLVVQGNSAALPADIKPTWLTCIALVGAVVGQGDVAHCRARWILKRSTMRCWATSALGDLWATNGSWKKGEIFKSYDVCVSLHCILIKAK